MTETFFYHHEQFFTSQSLQGHLISRFNAKAWLPFKMAQGAVKGLLSCLPACLPARTTLTHVYNSSSKHASPCFPLYKGVESTD